MSRGTGTRAGSTPIAILAIAVVAAVAGRPPEARAQSDNTMVLTKVVAEGLLPSALNTIKGYEHELVRQLEALGLVHRILPHNQQSESDFALAEGARVYVLGTLTATDRGVLTLLSVRELEDDGRFREAFDFPILLGDEPSVEENHDKIRLDVKIIFAKELIQYLEAGGRQLLTANCIHTDVDDQDMDKLSKDVTLIYPDHLMSSPLVSSYAIRGWTRDDYDYVCGAKEPHNPLAGASQHEVTGFITMLGDVPYVDLYWRRTGLESPRKVFEPLSGSGADALAREIVEKVVELAPQQ